MGGGGASNLASIPGYSIIGPLYLMSCGTTKFGIVSNAQKIAKALNRPIYAFLSKYTALWGRFKMRNIGDTLTFTGWPTFAKLKLFNP